MNNITICGSLGKDIKITKMPSGESVGNFSVADSQGKDKKPIWWNCSLFGKFLISIAPYLIKGQLVTVSGELTEKDWADKDGIERKQMTLIVRNLNLQGMKKESSDSHEPDNKKIVNSVKKQQIEEEDEIPF
jgi:single-strand DNA-binding protein